MKLTEMMRQRNRDRREAVRDRKFYALQRMTVLADLVKHLATLSIGAIALIAGFLKTLTKLGNNDNLLFFITTSFFVCIIFSAISYVLVAKKVEKDNVTGLGISRWYHPTNFISWMSIGSFFLGVTGLYLLILVNIFPQFKEFLYD